jgi:large subunit ribosomal protein L25
MNTVALSGTVRTTIGSKDAAHLRREKRVPCVLYGGENIVHFSVEESALNKLVFTPEVNGIELDLDGTKTMAMIHDKQFNPTTDRVEHVDFLELKEDQPTRVKLSIRLKGQPIGVRKGGKLNQSMRKLRVKGLPAHIPQHLDLDVTEMDINHTVRVKDLKFEGLTMMERADDVVVAVKQTKKVEVKTDAADDKKGAKKK